MDEMARMMGELKSGIESLNQQYAEHLAHDRAWHEKIESQIRERFDKHLGQDQIWHGKIDHQISEIVDTLSQAKGAKRLLVWLLGIVFASIALAKGWIGPRA